MCRKIIFKETAKIKYYFPPCHVITNFGRWQHLFMCCSKSRKYLGDYHTAFLLEIFSNRTVQKEQEITYKKTRILVFAPTIFFAVCFHIWNVKWLLILFFLQIFHIARVQTNLHSERNLSSQIRNWDSLSATFRLV